MEVRPDRVTFSVASHLWEVTLSDPDEKKVTKFADADNSEDKPADSEI